MVTDEFCLPTRRDLTLKNFSTLDSLCICKDFTRRAEKIIKCCIEIVLFPLCFGGISGMKVPQEILFARKKGKPWQKRLSKINNEAPEVKSVLWKLLVFSNVQGFNLKNRKDISYPTIIRSAIRPVPHGPDLPITSPPDTRDNILDDLDQLSHISSDSDDG
ncbi:hypothetical protein TNCV_4466431 [Trichonephila clavipes]|nr:hypothetical protein TNCV_4466431 [Trichonephila clavipes]